MTTEVSTKVVKINFREIIDNCLDMKFWEKKWVIFEYDNYEISINLNKIDISYGSVDLDMVVSNREENIQLNGLFWLPLKHYNETVFRKKLLSEAHSIIKNIERMLARRTDEYQNILFFEQELQDLYVLNLEAYLDSEGVVNEDIREAYIKQNKKSFNDKSSEFLSESEKNILKHVHNMVDNMIRFADREDD